MQHLTLCPCIWHEGASSFAVIPSPHLLSFAPVKIYYQEEDWKQRETPPNAKSPESGGGRGGRRADSFARSQPSASSPYNLQEGFSLNCCFALGTYGRPLRNGKDVGSGEEAGIGP